MEKLDFRISDPLGEDLIMTNEKNLSDYLDMPSDHWESGSGDSALWKNETDGLLFFKTGNEFFVMELGSYLSPIQNQEKLKWIKHYIGGDQFHCSSRHLCSKETLMKILLNYVKTSELLSEFEWADPLPDEDLFKEE